MQPKARMTFRFDGTAPKEAEREKPAEPQTSAAAARQEEERASGPATRASNSRTGDFYTWTGPFQDDIHALEEIIRASDRPSVAGFSKPAGAVRPVRAVRQPSAPPGQLPDKAPARPARGGVPAEAPEEGGPEELRSSGAQGARRTPSRPFSAAASGPADVRQSSAGREHGRPFSVSAGGGRRAPEEFPGAERTGAAHSNPPRPVYEEESRFAAEEDHSPEIDLSEEWPFGGAYSRRGGPSWWRTLATVVSAILTGGFFGYLLLALFSGQPLFAKDGSPSPASAPAMASLATTPDAAGASAPPATAPGAAAGTAAKAASAGGAAASGAAAGGAAVSGATASGAPASPSAGSTAVPASTYYLLQYGVFGTEDSMNAALKQLQDRGIPAAADTSEGYRVFAGIAAAKADAENMAERLPGVEVYVKSIENAGIDVAASPHAAEWSAYLKSSSALYLKIARITSAALAGPDAGTANTADIQAVEKAYQTWVALADQAGSWDEAAKDLAAAETKQMGDAVAALDEYAGKPSVSLLEQAQAAVMKAALADRQLRETLRMESGS